MSIVELWPLFGLTLRIGGLELRYPTDADLAALADLSRTPIHPSEVMPFSSPWTDAEPDERARSVLQWHWHQRGEWRPARWALDLVAVADGAVVGTQSISAEHFGVTRTVSTGSWVAAAHQGQGVGTAMRRAVLHLAFAALGADTARSGAFGDNAASLRVSEKLGYLPDGTTTFVRRGRRAEQIRLVLTRERWAELAATWPAVEVAGLGPCRSLLGLSPAGG